MISSLARISRYSQGRESGVDDGAGAGSDVTDAYTHAVTWVFVHSTKRKTHCSQEKDWIMKRAEKKEKRKDRHRDFSFTVSDENCNPQQTPQTEEGKKQSTQQCLFCLRHKENQKNNYNLCHFKDQCARFTSRVWSQLRSRGEWRYHRLSQTLTPTVLFFNCKQS